MVVDSEGGNLLDELQEVDGRVEKRRLKLFLEVRVGVLGLDTLNVLRDIYEGGNVDGELAEDGSDNVRIENVVLGALFGQSFDGLTCC